MILPQKLPLDLMQTKWGSILDPFLGRPTNSVSLLKNVVLAVGANVINHQLGRVQQGWFFTDKQGAAEVYRSAPFNNLTLTLTSDAVVTVSIGVF